MQVGYEEISVYEQCKIEITYNYCEPAERQYLKTYRVYCSLNCNGTLRNDASLTTQAILLNSENC